MKTLQFLILLFSTVSLVGQQSNNNSAIDVIIKDDSGPSTVMIDNPDSSSMVINAPTSLMRFLDKSDQQASLVWRNGVLNLYTMQPSGQTLGTIDPTLTLDGNRRLGIGLPATATPAFLLDVNGKMRLSDDATTALPGSIRYTQNEGFQGFHSGTWSSMVNPSIGTKWMVGPLLPSILTPGSMHQVTSYVFHIEDFIHSPQIQDHYEVLQTGTYMINFQASISQSNISGNQQVDNGIVDLLIRKNDQNITGGKSRFIVDLVNGYTTQLETSVMIKLNAGDDITFYVLSHIDIPDVNIRLESGNTSGGGFDTLMRAHRID